MHWTLRVAGILMPLGILYTFLAPDAEGFMNPELARVVFYHLPCAFLSVIYLCLSGYYAIRYFRSRDMKWDHRLGGAVDLTALLSALTMVTGIMFSKVQWGEWWHWDPRQTSFLVVLFIYAGALALRAGFDDPVKRAKATSGYMLAALLPTIFLVFVFPNMPEVKQRSLHPTGSAFSAGGMDSAYRMGYLVIFLLLGFFTAAIFRAKVKTDELHDQLENENGLDQTGGSGSSAPRVVRPVALHEPDQQTTE